MSSRRCSTIWRAGATQQAGRGLIPESTIDKPPSAELRPDQKDTDSLPPYDVLDPILRAYVEEDRSPDAIVRLGFDAATVRRVMALVDRSEYKRRQAPPGVKITRARFGRDRRLPITNGYRDDPETPGVERRPPSKRAGERRQAEPAGEATAGRG